MRRALFVPAALVAAGIAVTGAAPASAADLAGVSTSSTEHDGAVVVTDVEWELPADAVVGDVLTVPLPDHHDSALGPVDLVADSGAVPGAAVLTPSGELRVVLSSVGDDVRDRRGGFVITTTTTTTATSEPGRRFSGTSTGTLSPGQRPGAFGGAVDRARANKYGQWTDEAETAIGWVVESPAGPWDTLTMTDPARPGQQLRCETATVRTTTTTDAETGYLVDLVTVSPERMSIACDERSFEVTVRDVAAGEFIEARIEAVTGTAEEGADYGATPPPVYRNIAAVEAVRAPRSAESVERVSVLQLHPGEPVEEPPAEPGEPAVPTTPPAATPPEPRLPATGGSADHAPLVLSALAAIAAGAVAVIAASRVGARRRA